MKLKLKLCFFCSVIYLFLITENSNAQFIINSAYNPAVGDTSIERYIDTTGIVPGDSGINKVWNFPNLTITGDPTTEYFVSPSSTPYYNQFPNSNLASLHIFSKSSMLMYHYWIVSDTSFVNIGYVFPGYFVLKFPNPSPRIIYPIFYGSQYSRNYNAVQTAGNTIDYIWGSMTQTCDGYGTIILPSGTINNVIRVKNITDEVDTTKTGGVVTNITHNIYTGYSWYRMGYKFEVFSISFVNSGTSIIKYVFYETNNKPVGINQISTTVPDKFALYQNYPNPFNPSTNIKFQIKESGFVSLKVYDILGKEKATLVKKNLTAGEYETSFDASGYTSGSYFYRLETNNYSSTKKMTILK